jgi:anti-sigma factor RsiW
MNACEHDYLVLPYHLGGLDAYERSSIEAHLPTCASCVSEFVRLKRSLEAAEDGPAPPLALRQRVRNSVATELARSAGEVRRFRLSWERPMAFAFAVVVGLFAMAFSGWVANSKGHLPLQLVRGGNFQRMVEP